jgi:hypothetical protein
MTILIGFAGYDCASAAEANPSANTASTNTRTCLILALLLRFRRFVILRAEISPVIPARGGIQQLGNPWVLNKGKQIPPENGLVQEWRQPANTGQSLTVGSSPGQFPDQGKSGQCPAASISRINLLVNSELAECLGFHVPENG